MSCYAYEELASPFLTDKEFDALGLFIAENWDGISHRHKYLVDRDSCYFTSGITKPYHEWPLIILGATHHRTNTPQGQTFAEALAWRNCEDLF